MPVHLIYVNVFYQITTGKIKMMLPVDLDIAKSCAYMPLIRTGFLTGLQCPRPS